ncbi:MAG: retropepsin-like domain-containing protein [Spirochaetaceae bacterium]|jgi:predicted aspartyl protease|nr:retropepsin-like domain-containing protein [Spirochaetaceae bacterium]
MSTFTETITLTNARDLGNADDGIIPASKIRSITVEACVDTGAWFLVINEKTRADLGLEITGSSEAVLADGSTATYPVTEPVEFRWKDRKKSMEALVIGDADEILFGALCMEALDLMADPVDECLKGRHGDKALYRVKSTRLRSLRRLHKRPAPRP